MSNPDTKRLVRSKSVNRLAAHVGASVVAAYAREARKRQMSVARLVAKTLRCVASSKLFDAVLDQEDA